VERGGPVLRFILRYLILWWWNFCCWWSDVDYRWHTVIPFVPIAFCSIHIVHSGIGYDVIHCYVIILLLFCSRLMWLFIRWLTYSGDSGILTTGVCCGRAMNTARCSLVRFCCYPLPFHCWYGITVFGSDYLRSFFLRYLLFCWLNTIVPVYRCSSRCCGYVVRAITSSFYIIRYINCILHWYCDLCSVDGHYSDLYYSCCWWSIWVGDGILFYSCYVHVLFRWCLLFLTVIFWVFVGLSRWSIY